MPRSDIERIRQRIRHRQYDMSAHAMEEMAEDGLDLVNVEHAVLHGEITRIERDDPRGTKHVIEGMAANEPQFVGVVGRFVETGRYLVITVYALRNNHEDF